MHIAAADPKYVRREEVPAEALEKEKDIYRAQLAQAGKKPEMIEKILEGKLDSYLRAGRAVDQKSIRDPAVKVSQIIAEATAKMGENITVSRFARFKIGEAAESSVIGHRHSGARDFDCRPSTMRLIDYNSAQLCLPRRLLSTNAFC